MPLRDGFFSTATQTSCCNRIQRSNRVRLLVVSTHDFPDRVNSAKRDEGTIIINPISHNTRFSLGVEDQRADTGGRDGRASLARPNSQARTGRQGKNISPLSSCDHEQDCKP